MNLNEKCQFCGNYLDPVWFVMSPELSYGEWKCKQCRREHVITEVDKDLPYEYPFEGRNN